MGEFRLMESMCEPRIAMGELADVPGIFAIIEYCVQEWVKAETVMSSREEASYEIRDEH